MTQFGNLVHDGFTVIKNPFPHLYLDKVRNWLDVQLSVLADSRFYSPHFEYGLRDMPTFGILYDLWQRYPLVRDFASHPSIYQSLLPVIGEDIFLYENSFLFKTPNTLDHVPWHQDFMNRPDEPLKYIAFISVDSLRHDQGALKVIPGSHKNGFYPYRVNSGQAAHTGIPEDRYEDLQLDQAVYIDQDPGDILIFNQLLVHSLDKITSGNSCPCRSFRFSYQGFDQMYSPRLSPISIFGGNPVSVHHHQFQPHPKSLRGKSALSNIFLKFKNKILFS